MSSFLQEQIQTRMEAVGLSVYGLEKKAGLKRSAVRNILQGFSQKPSADVVSAIANALDCTLNDLVGSSDGSTVKLKKRGTVWSDKLYIEAVQSIAKHLSDKNQHLNFEQAAHLVAETYKYSIAKSATKIDDDFSKWLVEKIG